MWRHDDTINLTPASVAEPPQVIVNTMPTWLRVEKSGDMPGPFVSALAAIPWPVILRQAPILLKAADALLASSRRRSVDQTAATDVQALRARIAELEQQQQAYADVVKQLADHINALTVAAQASSLRSRQSFVVATVGVGLGLVACLLAWSR